MKPLLIATLLLAFFSGPIALGQNGSVSSSSSSSSESVTITSDGKRTVKKTVTTRDGVTTTTTEVTDEKGNVTTTRTGGPGNPGETKPDGPWIGLRVKEASPELREQLGLAGNEGLVAELVATGGPAAKAGMQPRDLILTVDGVSVGTPADLRGLVRSKKVGDTLAVVYLRKGQRQTTRVTVENPAPGSLSDEDPGIGDRILEQLGRDGTLPKGAHTDMKVETKIHGKGGVEAIDDLLKDPDVPETIKDQLRELRSRLKP